MNALINTNNITMSSREIADLVELRHDNVKRTIKSLAEKEIITFPQIEEKPTDGRPTTEYIFSGEKGKRDSIIIVAQLSPAFTGKLVDRWLELEKQTSLDNFKIPKDFSSALRLAADLQDKVALLSNKTEALDKIATAKTGSMTITSAAKHLQIKPSELFSFLEKNRWIYRREKGRPIAYQDKIQAGLLEHKYFIVKKEDGEAHYPQVLLTQKGIVKISQLLTMH